jgi:hypothetical protein
VSLQPLVDRHAILAMEKQFRLYDVVEERAWSADLDAGTVSFSAGGEPPVTMGATLLGTQADGSWLWGWANPGGFPEPVVAAGCAVADYGREHDLAPLYAPESPVSDDVRCDRIGIIASGVVPLAATYRAPADGTLILFGLDHPDLALGELAPERLLTVMSALLQTGIVRDWLAACEAYAEQRGVSFDGRVLAGAIEIELDDLGRITNLSARLERP